MLYFLDTVAVSHIFTKHPDYVASLQRFSARGFPSDVYEVSAVTVMELAAWGKDESRWTLLEPWLLSRYTVVPLDGAAAVAGARLERVVLDPIRAERPVKKKERRGWSCDSAILGTAAHRGADVFVTAEKRYHLFRKHFAGEILILEGSPSPLAS